MINLLSSHLLPSSQVPSRLAVKGILNRHCSYMALYRPTPEVSLHARLVQDLKIPKDIIHLGCCWGMTHMGSAAFLKGRLTEFTAKIHSAILFKSIPHDIFLEINKIQGLQKKVLPVATGSRQEDGIIKFGTLSGIYSREKFGRLFEDVGYIAKRHQENVVLNVVSATDDKHSNHIIGYCFDHKEDAWSLIDYNIKSIHEITPKFRRRDYSNLTFISKAIAYLLGARRENLNNTLDYLYNYDQSAKYIFSAALYTTSTNKRFLKDITNMKAYAFKASDHESQDLSLLMEPATLQGCLTTVKQLTRKGVEQRLILKSVAYSQLEVFKYWFCRGLISLNDSNLVNGIVKWAVLANDIYTLALIAGLGVQLRTLRTRFSFVTTDHDLLSKEQARAFEDLSLAAASACFGYSEMLHLLAKYEVDLVGQGEKLTPASIAALKGQVNALKSLRSLGIDLTQPDGLGNTPLFYAQTFGHLECVQFLS